MRSGVSWGGLLMVAAIGFRGVGAVVLAGAVVAVTVAAPLSGVSAPARPPESVSVLGRAVGVAASVDASAGARDRGRRAEVLQARNAEQWSTYAHSWRTTQGTMKVEAFGRPAFRRTADGWERLSAETGPQTPRG